jgi:hypothetical protein
LIRRHPTVLKDAQLIEQPGKHPLLLPRLHSRDTHLGSQRVKNVELLQAPTRLLEHEHFWLIEFKPAQQIALQPFSPHGVAGDPGRRVSGTDSVSALLERNTA